MGRILLIGRLAAVLAAAIGLLIGWLVAPLFTGPGAALLGSAGTPPVTLATIGVVVAVAVALAAVATLVPAVCAARTSTVRILADSAVNKDGGPVTLPPVWWLAATVLGTAAAVTAITLVPAWLGTRRPAGEILRSELV